MKTRLTAVFCLMLIASASMAQGKYAMKGTIRNADGQMVYLNHGSVKDSTLVKKGKFAFKGAMDKPYESAILYMGKLEGRMDEVKYVQFSLEPGKLTADIDANEFKKAVIHGGKTQEENNALQAQMAEINKQLEELNNAYRNAANAEEGEAIKAKMEPYSKQASELRNNFMNTHPDSYLTPQFLRYAMSRMNYQELKSMYDRLSDNVKRYGDCEEIVKEISALERVQQGKPAPDFTANDINGRPFTMSSLRGHVTIIDFWASWCVPCRKSNPHMLELYRKYRAKGLEMVYVSDDDRNEKAWKKAVADDKLVGEGFHHVLRGLKWDRSKGYAGIDHTNDISDKYAIHYLPTKYLIDQKGNIVCKVESDEQLERELEKLLGKAEYPFTIKGNVANAEGKEVTLYYGSMRKQDILKTTVKDGQFTLSGVISSPYTGGSLLLGEYNPQAGEGDFVRMAIEPGTTTVDAPKGTLNGATVKGGKAQDDVNAYDAQLNPVIEEMKALDSQMKKAKTDKQRNALKAKMEAAREKYNDVSKTFYTTRGDSYLSPQLLMMDMGNMKYEDIKKIYNTFSENVRLYGDTKEIEDELEALGKIQPGSAAPDFTANDINGRPFTFSSLKGKVVIIDFWASWCVPCRKSNPHMKALYEKYHDKGLEMVYVSDDDRNEKAWKAAVEKDGLVGEGFHHVLRGLKQTATGFDKSNDISALYAIHYLPTKYLIDRQGNIVCKINEGEDQQLDQKLEELLK